MHARGAPDHHPSSSRAGYAPLNAPHAPLPDEGAAERIAQRVCTPRGVMIAALCAGAFYFGGASARAPAPGVGARRAWMEETPASPWRARRRRPRSGDGRAGTRREPRACPRASSIVTGRASTTTTTRRGPRAPRESVIGGGRRRRRRTTFWIRPAVGARGPGATFRGARGVRDAARGTTRTGADPFPRRGFDSRRGRRRPGEAGGRRESGIGSRRERMTTQLAGGSTSSNGASAPPCSNRETRHRAVVGLPTLSKISTA